MNSLKKELVSVRIPIELNTEFANHVAKIGVSKNAFILGLIYDELKKESSETKTSVATVEACKNG